jgi:hypothetical protein
VAKGGEKKRVNVYIERVNFKGPVKVSLKNLPDGISSSPITIPPNKDTDPVFFIVDPHLDAPISAPITVVAEANGLTAETTLELKAIPDPLRPR